jgi:two-component system, cell cycle response regulator
MSGRVLVVDDILPNVKLLEARLTAEYFSVVTAMNGPAALEICDRGECDIVLLDVMMPGMDGFEVCRRLRANPKTAHLPIVFITALDQPSDRVKGLEAGGDDFLTKPFNEVALLARVRSLLRLKIITDELRSRSATSVAIGMQSVEREAQRDNGQGGNVLLIDDRASAAQRLAELLQTQQKVSIAASAEQGVAEAAKDDLDLIIVGLGMENFDGLRLVSQLRAHERIRQIPILVVAEGDDDTRVMRALDMGVNDFVARPIDRNELSARVRTQVRRQRYAKMLRASMQSSIELAVTDPLTGLSNRRYFTSHVTSMLGAPNAAQSDLTLLILDIDHFKRINDTYGHDVGDEVLREFAHRMKEGVRGIDLICRLGGEEFVIVMPETDPIMGFRIADRLRQSVAERPFAIRGGREEIAVTVSIGLTGLRGHDSSPDTLLKRADEALYKAKKAGRNRVIADAA